MRWCTSEIRGAKRAQCGRLLLDHCHVADELDYKGRRIYRLSPLEVAQIVRTSC